MGDPEFFYDLQQGTPEWHELRRGIPTASIFKTILVDGDGADTLLYRLAGERCSGQLAEGYKNAAMARGQEMESDARNYFSSSRMLDVERCGFVRRLLPSGRYVGCSPDSFFLGQNGKAVLEIKTMIPENMIRACEEGKASYGKIVAGLPKEHYAQCQGALWITGFHWVELIVWYRGMSWANHYAMGRDERFIEKLANAVANFDARLDAMVQKYGGPSQS